MGVVSEQARFRLQSKRCVACVPSGTGPERARASRGARVGALTTHVSRADSEEMERASQKRGDVLHGYTLVDLLGEGGMGQTWRARHIATGAEHALKVLHVEQASDWKVVELFEREAQVLASIQHPRVPAYVDRFALEGGGAFALVQELAPGETLEARLARGEVFDTARWVDLADQLLDVLVYLQSLDPPIVHRDVKPQNVIVDDEGRARLVDFGAVRAELRDDSDGGGSTVVGTFGYMAPEQFRGAASPETDLYGLGATLLFAATGRHPEEFEHVRMEIQFADAISLPPRLEAWLKRMLAPVAEDRYRSALLARAALHDEKVDEDEALRLPALPLGEVQLREHPPDGRLTLHRSPESLVMRSRTPRSLVGAAWVLLMTARTWVLLNLALLALARALPVMLLSPWDQEILRTPLMQLWALSFLILPALSVAYHSMRTQVLTVSDDAVELRTEAPFLRRSVSWALDAPMALNDGFGVRAENTLQLLVRYARGERDIASWASNRSISGIRAPASYFRGLRLLTPSIRESVYFGTQLSASQREELVDMIFLERAHRYTTRSTPLEEVILKPEAREVSAEVKGVAVRSSK